MYSDLMFCEAINCVQSVEELYLPDQSPVLNVILSPEVNDHRRPELVDALENNTSRYLVYFLKQHDCNTSIRLHK